MFLGLLWCNASFSEDLSKRKVHESKIDIAWKVDDKFIIPECFDYVWYSGDNYETFFDEYIEKLDSNHWASPAFEKFVIEIGNYLNKEVPLNHSIKTGWEGIPEISLTRKLDGCLSDKPETYIYHTDEYGGKSSIEYEVIKSFDLKIGKELAPHINEKFESIKQVEVTEWGGGSMGPKEHVAVYGILKLDGKKVILPLANRSLIEEEPKDEKIIDADTSYNWIKNQTEFNDTMHLVGDDKQQFQKFIKSNMSTRSFFDFKDETLYRRFISVLLGPPHKIRYLEDRRYLVGDACMAHYCIAKGLFFIDTKEKHVIGVIRHYDTEPFDLEKDQPKSEDFLIFSKTHKKYEDLPELFFKSVDDWIKGADDYDPINPQVIRFIGADDKIIDVTSKY